jgi:hypothetical protein
MRLCRSASLRKSVAVRTRFIAHSDAEALAPGNSSPKVGSTRSGAGGASAAAGAVDIAQFLLQRQQVLPVESLDIK